jgi:hypothetical protein
MRPAISQQGKMIKQKELVIRTSMSDRLLFCAAEGATFLTSPVFFLGLVGFTSPFSWSKTSSGRS